MNIDNGKGGYAAWRILTARRTLTHFKPDADRQLLKIYPHKFPAFLFPVLLIIKLVQLPGAVWHVKFIFMGVLQQTHGEKLLPEITPVQLYLKDCLI